MALTKRLGASRFVEIRQGDTLQQIAQREMGDAQFWTDLIAINDLAPPYLTGDLSLAGQKVRLYGESLIVPAVSSQTATSSDPTRVFLADVALAKGQLEPDATGDLALVAGRENLAQAYRNRLDTPLDELLFHPTYGNGAHSLKGQAGSPGTATLSAQYVRSALKADPRTRTVDSTKATITGDVTEVVASVTPITGSAIDASAKV